MNNTIYKTYYDLLPSGELKLPKGSTILSCANQYDKIAIWFWTDYDYKYGIDEYHGDIETWQFYAVKTGNDWIPDDKNWTFLGTVLCFDNMFVYHVFYRKAENKYDD